MRTSKPMLGQELPIAQATGNRFGATPEAKVSLLARVHS
jgi:hypothetical protein